MTETHKDHLSDSRHVLIGSAFVLMAAFGFSAKAILIKIAYSESQVDPITLMALRMGMALPFFLVAACWLDRGPRARHISCREWLILIGLGTIGYYLASFLDFSGLTYISAGLERLILFLYPTLVVLFSAAVNGRPFQSKEIIALILSYTGIVLVFVGNVGLAHAELWLGSALVFGSAVMFAIYMMGSGFMIPRIGSVRFTTYSMIFACFATGIHFGISHGTQLMQLSAEVYGLALLMAILSTVMPAFLMNAGIHRLGASPASIISSAGPVGTLVLAYFLLDEEVTVWQLVGTVLVLGGVYTVSRPTP